MKVGGCYVSRATVAVVKAALEQRGLETGGSKPEIRARLEEAMIADGHVQGVREKKKKEKKKKEKKEKKKKEKKGLQSKAARAAKRGATKAARSPRAVVGCPEGDRGRTMQRSARRRGVARPPDPKSVGSCEATGCSCELEQGGFALNPGKPFMYLQLLQLAS